jgi:DNA-directed RNA polymerase subunit M/transcription elongation factor TFIIS
MGAQKTVINYRCEACGNKTRFDVYDTVRRKRFEHADLGGEVTVEDEEIVSRTVDQVVCRWCDHSDTVVETQPNL